VVSAKGDFKMKQTTLAFIIATRLVAPGIAFAAEYGFTGWNDDGVSMPHGWSRRNL